MEGICDNLDAGLTKLEVHVSSCSGYSGIDAYTGWQSGAYVVLDEVHTISTGIHGYDGIFLFIAMM